MAKNKATTRDLAGTAQKGFEEMGGIDRHELELLKERIKRLENILAQYKKTK